LPKYKFDLVTELKVRKLREKGIRPKQISAEMGIPLPAVMSILLRKDKPKVFKAGVRESFRVPKPKREEYEIFERGEKIPTTTIKVHPAVLMLFNHLKKGGYRGSFSDFINVSVLRKFNLDPLFAVESDEEVIKLKKKLVKMELKDRIKRRISRLDLDKEISEILDYIASIKVLEGVEAL